MHPKHIDLAVFVGHGKGLCCLERGLREIKILDIS